MLDKQNVFVKTGLMSTFLICIMSLKSSVLLALSLGSAASVFVSLKFTQVL